MNKLFLIAGGGALLYWWYSKQTPATTPGTITTGGQQPQPTTTTVPLPQPGNITVTPPSTVPPGIPPVEPRGTQTPRQTLMDVIRTTSAQVKQDPSLRDANGSPLATFSQWNWYLMTYGGQSDLPDYFTASGGQTDPNTPLTADQYWNLMGRWLMANRGLSGLDVYMPAYRPAYARSRYLGPGGWMA